MSQYQEIIDDLSDIGFDFRINDLDETLEIKNGVWQRMSDTLEAVIKTQLREVGYSGKKKPSLSAARDAYITRAHERRYNPIRDYFDSLKGVYTPSANGLYHIPTLASYFKNPDGQFSAWLFKWMVGAIAKIYRGERNAMLVLVAPQRVGKSYFAGWICPLKDRFLKSSINPDNKDSNLRLTDTLVWEVEELGSTTRRADIEALKAFITKPFIYERPPYGRHPIYKPSNASFIGTVNYDGAGFLNDPTGSTRFLSCEIETIDFAYTQIDINDLWAEALWFYQTMDRVWELSDQEKETQARINNQFEVVSALADVVENRFEVTSNAEDFMTTQEILNHIEGYYRHNNAQQLYNELGRVLRKLGCDKGKLPSSKGGFRGYYGIKVRVANDVEK